MTEITQMPILPQLPTNARPTARGRLSQPTARTLLRRCGVVTDGELRETPNARMREVGIGDPPEGLRTPASFAFTVPGRPVSWKRTKGGKVGQRYNATRQKVAQKRIEIRAREAIPNDWSTSGRFVVNIAAAFKWPFLETRSSEPDADNVAKLVNEALEGVAFLNDRQATTVIVEKRYLQAAEWLDVRVTRVG